ncbi:MAG: sigma-70 family RNA polymerase sigma factor, partial [Gemmataceae bacterium]|nr:sigma-70 family RNA polymerase sigma factor [Gemmataceae bacterium]
MGNRALEAVVRLLREQPLRDESDARLLERFASAKDQAAFSVLVERHGPMVFGVCLRLLRCPHDAEDCFQAAFLVLSQRAGSIRKSASLACWLHGVARRAALKLQRERQRRQRREAASAPRQPSEPTWAEAAAALDEELERLPDAYREALVCCCLEGLSRDEAASRLGVEAGIVKGRLERGRKMLAARLEKRGLALSAGLLAALSPGLASAATRAAALFASGGTGSATVVALANGIMKGMAMSKVKLIGAGLACALTMMAGVGYGLAQGPMAGGGDGPAGLFGGMGGGVDKAPPPTKEDGDEAFIRRMSRDLRGTDPTPTEVHFFVASADKKKRDKLVDLFIKERGDRKASAAKDLRAERE